jgi:hypothetical protein
MSARWGKAGVRLAPEEVEQRDRAVRSRRNREASDDRRREETAYRLWRHGELRPCWITHALDFRGLYGPEVDEACGAKEPDVDLWEAGKLYPTWEQLLLLAKLTRYPLGAFTRRELPLPFEATSLRFHMLYDERTEPVVDFAPDAVAKVVAGYPERLGASPVGEP